MLAIRERSVKAVTLIATSAHPGVMRKRIQYAKERGGHKDRKDLDTALRFLPSKGPSVIVVPGGQVEGGEEGGEGGEIDTDFIFPDLSQTQKLLARPRREE